MANAARNRRERQKADVRASLIEAAHTLVREEGYDGLTIRKLAERIGYAPMSVYSYFPDKHSILFALAQDAFASLARRMDRDAPADPLDALRKLMREYAAFGFENPNEYRTVFMTGDPAMIQGKAEEELQKRNPAMQLLVSRVGACVESGAFQGDVHAISTLIWSCGHGAVSLLLSFPTFPFGVRDAYVERMIDFVVAGLRAGTTPPLRDADDGAIPPVC